MTTVQVLLGKENQRDHVSLLAYVLGKPREWILAHPEASVRPGRAARFRRLLARLDHGEPLAQIIGEQWFYGRPFTVNRHVLIPRPESELLVEIAIRRIRNDESGIMVADIGTGSGCIAVTIAAELPTARVTAIDVSPAALRVARKNAKRHGVDGHIVFRHDSILHWCPTKKYDRRNGWEQLPANTPTVILANLPYLTTAEWRALPKSLKAYEPRAAFDGGHDGLKYFRKLFAQVQAIPIIHDSLFMILEIDPRRKVALASIVRTMLSGWHATWRRDIAGRWRVLEMRA